MRTVKHTVKDPNGIHARPAGVLVNIAKGFESQIFIVSGDKRGDCKRIFSLMGMSLKYGDTFTVEISGVDEEAAAAAISEAIKSSGI